MGDDWPLEKTPGSKPSHVKAGVVSFGGAGFTCTIRRRSRGLSESEGRSIFPKVHVINEMGRAKRAYILVGICDSPCHLSASWASAARILVLADHEISRFPSKERAHMPVSKTTPGRLGARVIAPIRVAFRHRNDVGSQDEGTFAAQWLAYALPCQRFANTLTGICA